MGLVIDSARYAAGRHAGQTRKYNGKPYITHPIRVAGRVATHDLATDELVAAAFLHDVIEDCGVTVQDIEARFGMVVATFVEHLTNTSKATGLPRRERKRIDRERIALIPRECKVVKLIDRIDNLGEIDRGSDFASLYAAESLQLLDVLRDADESLANELNELARTMI